LCVAIVMSVWRGRIDHVGLLAAARSGPFLAVQATRMLRELLAGLLLSTSISGGIQAANPPPRQGPSASEQARMRKARAVRDMPLAVRCDLVRTLFSQEAFDELYAYLGSSCAGRARMGGQARVLASVDDDIWYGDTGIGPPRPPLFSKAERCEGPRFVVLPRDKALASKQVFIHVSVKPKEKGSYSFVVSVGVANGTAGCAGVTGLAVLKGRKWTVRPDAQRGE
jgi:hypothetical protein